MVLIEGIGVVIRVGLRFGVWEGVRVPVDVEAGEGEVVLDDCMSPAMDGWQAASNSISRVVN